MMQQALAVRVFWNTKPLPNLATNMADPHCGNSATVTAYKTGIAYAVNKFKGLHVTMYLDGAHGGWLGWTDNLQQFTSLVVSTLGSNLASLRGFSTNVANYQPVGIMCPFQSNDGIRNDYCLNGQHQTDPCCADPCMLESQYNPGNNELNYINVLYRSMRAAAPAFTPYFVIDTGRNGVVNMRSSCANWCNARGAGIGMLPTAVTAAPALVDAYFWLKTPGESDGCTQLLPDGSTCPRYDSFCGSVDSIGSRAGEPRAPQAGNWFDYQIKQLAVNALLLDYSNGNNSPMSSPSLSPHSLQPIPTIEIPTARPSLTPSQPTRKPSRIPSAPSVAATRLPSVSPTALASYSPWQLANPFARTLNYYVNPSYQQELESSIVTATGQTKLTLQSMMQVSSAYWIDVKSKISGLDTSSVQGILMDAASKPQKQLVTFIIYDLPNRDCHVSECHE